VLKRGCGRVSGGKCVVGDGGGGDGGGVTPGSAWAEVLAAGARRVEEEEGAKSERLRMGEVMEVMIVAGATKRRAREATDDGQSTRERTRRRAAFVPNPVAAERSALGNGGGSSGGSRIHRQERTASVPLREPVCGRAADRRGSGR
jgi:hypothetical protein